MGAGISLRERKFREHWKKHFICTKELIADSLGKISGNEVAILGAGRLFDVDVGTLADRFSIIHLVDADPGVLPYWRQVTRRYGASKIKSHLLEVTGAIDQWCEELKRNLPVAINTQAVKESLTCLEKFAPKQLELPNADLTISLNLMSQIPIYWRDRVVKILDRHKLLESIDLDNLLCSSMASLQARHLGLLCSHSREAFLVISDTEFYYYRWSGEHWETAPALFGEAVEAWQRAKIEKFNIERIQSWWWHLVPQYLDGGEWGEIHRVEGRLYKR